jgi:hypothetical protein
MFFAFNGSSKGFRPAFYDLIIIVSSNEIPLLDFFDDFIEGISYHLLIELTTTFGYLGRLTDRISQLFFNVFLFVLADPDLEIVNVCSGLKKMRCDIFHEHLSLAFAMLHQFRQTFLTQFQ